MVDAYMLIACSLAIVSVRNQDSFSIATFLHSMLIAFKVLAMMLLHLWSLVPTVRAMMLLHLATRSEGASDDATAPVVTGSECAHLDAPLFVPGGCFAVAARNGFKFKAVLVIRESIKQDGSFKKAEILNVKMKTKHV